jgi:hypothetical protein
VTFLLSIFSPSPQVPRGKKTIKEAIARLVYLINHHGVCAGALLMVRTPW